MVPGLPGASGGTLEAHHTTAAKSKGVLYKIEAHTPARGGGGRKVKIEALISASGRIDLGPEPKIQRDLRSFRQTLTLAPAVMSCSAISQIKHLRLEAFLGIARCWSAKQALTLPPPGHPPAEESKF